MLDSIVIRGARTHNLKNISLEIPRNQLVVITGVSGSGKSSLAFDTLYAEGQRRYVESLSAYARQFLERMDRPDVDEVRGIAPAIAIEQKNPTRSARSTVGTATEIQDYLRLLLARIGHTFCPGCGKEVKKFQVQDVVDHLARLERGSKIHLTFKPLRHNGLAQELALLRSRGFFRAVIAQDIIPFEELKIDDPNTDANLAILVDRLVLRAKDDPRLADSLSLAFAEGGGRLEVRILGGDTLSFSQHYECLDCQLQFIEPQPRLFSFNNPFGACPRCKGLGDIVEIDHDLVVPDPRKSIAQGAIVPWTTPGYSELWDRLLKIAPKVGIDTQVPYAELSEAQRQIIWNGHQNFPGVQRFFDWLETKKYKISARVFLSRYRGYVRCPDCQGTRLRPEALNVKIGGKNCADIARLTLAECQHFFASLEISAFEAEIVGQILKELKNRLDYLVDIGLGYLSLERRTATLSGGEFQRINLATALGSQLVGSLYVLDEPTIGLHPRDNQRLGQTLMALRDIGNTVVIVEHDRDLIRLADHIIDLGPAAGANGGEIVAQGNFRHIQTQASSLTGQYLAGQMQIPRPARPPRTSEQYLKIIGAAENNLKNLTVRIPLRALTVVTGVSGSGKSSLVYDVLYHALQKELGQRPRHLGKYDRLEGSYWLDAVELVDQSPIGKTPRSNPATYLKAFDPIRKLFAGTRRAQVRGLKPGAFSFNVSGGRCDRCEGAGVIKIEMQFLADVYLECDQCGGQRYKKEVLEITYHGCSIAEVLNMTVTEALTCFAGESQVLDRLKLLSEVGLGYIKLGQPATTLSGGEAQRVKLAAHLGERAHRHVLYIFDEPTTGLHFHDVATLLKCFDRILAAGNSLLVIEHNMDVIKCADHIIDLGPEGGDRGGYLVAEGAPEQIAANEASHTGRFLKEYLTPS